MSELSPGVNESAAKVPGVEPDGRRRWQVGLRTVFLLVAAIAVWIACFINRRQNATIQARIEAMLPLAHELVIEDAKKIAVVRLEENWYDENRWEVYLPDASYRLCIATRGINANGLATVKQSMPIPAGRHGLALEQRQVNDAWRVAVSWDGKERLAVDEPKEWKTSGSSTGVHYSVSAQLSPDKPAVLFRRRFMRRSGTRTASPSGPTEGVLLWIERTTETALTARPSE